MNRAPQVNRRQRWPQLEGGIMIRQQNTNIDEDGHFGQDSGYALICIFDSQDGRRKSITESSWQRPVVANPSANNKAQTSPLSHCIDNEHSSTVKSGARPMKFINTAHPRQNKRPKKLKGSALTPVNQQSLRSHQRGENEKSPQEPVLIGGLSACGGTVSLCNATKEYFQPVILAKQNRQSLRTLTTYPIVIKPYMYSLMEFCTVPSFFVAGKIANT
jgi:hypothetical protein